MVIFKVHMLAFMGGLFVREVEIPIDRVRAIFSPDPTAVESLNDLVYLFGQNGIKRDEEFLSVSHGDVIEWPEEVAGSVRYFSIDLLGYSELDAKEVRKLKSAGEARALIGNTQRPGIETDPLASIPADLRHDAAKVLMYALRSSQAMASTSKVIGTPMTGLRAIRLALEPSMDS